MILISRAEKKEKKHIIRTSRIKKNKKNVLVLYMINGL